MSETELIFKLRREHLKIGSTILSLEEIISRSFLDIRLLNRGFNYLFDFLERHEIMEDPFFERFSLEDKEIEFLVEEINKIHSLIKGHITVLKIAFASGNREFIRSSLDNDGRMLFSKLREHMHYEEKVFDSILFFNPFPSNRDY